MRPLSVVRGAFIVVVVGGFLYACVSSCLRAVAPEAYQTASSTPAEPPLELQAASWHSEYGYAIFEGAVKNVSAKSLDGVEAVATFYDKDGGFITSDSAMVDYQPILPGQTTPFKVMGTWNPAMKSANVEFKHILGGTIACKEAPPKPKSKPQPHHRRRHK